MSAVQHELNDFLQSELYHTLGSYGTTVRRLRELHERVAHARRRDTDKTFDTLFPSDAVTNMRRYNELLRTTLHYPTSLSDRNRASDTANARHPQPKTRLDGADVRDRWILDFYATAILALKTCPSDESAAGLQEPAQPNEDAGFQPLSRLGHILAIVHDPQRRGVDRSMPIAGRIARNEHRLLLAQSLLGQTLGRDRAGEIVTDCLTSPNHDQLHTHVVGALVDAHICMHRAEHLMAKNFGEKITNRSLFDHEIEGELKRSLMLNTFVYVVGRTVSWIFAEDEAEREFVLDNYEECCGRLSPTYCMWIGNQLSLLALHRRAYTYLLMSKPNDAYNDFHKLRRFARNLERQLGKTIARAPGAEAFLTGLGAFADHHSGRIYRSQHAHTTALGHFDRAAERLATLEADPDLLEMLHNSRWRIDLLMSQAKANYELGRIKRSLFCYARAWRSFLELADTESFARANFSIVDEVIAWLRDVETDADIDKVELQRHFEPLVQQFQMMLSPTHLRVLAAEIMMRVGHVLFILRLPKTEGERVVKREIDSSKPSHGLTMEAMDSRYPEVDHRLAHRSLLQAAILDPASTLIAADLRKFEYWKHSLDVDPKTSEPVAAPAPADIRLQWPGGSGEFEEAARVVEYVLQCWLSETYDETSDNVPASERIARRLLAAFLAHTDSSNVKLAQVYRYLMQDSSYERESRRRASLTNASPSIELVCLRRYSSFFPFLPRPSAFRVLGGGYFARVESPKSDEGAFGVVIDPGPHFIDNLYRCGYCLDDVHMIVVTHDHADHIAALDALLGLLGYRDMYGAETFAKDNRLAIVGNESVRQRYAFFNESASPDNVSVWTFEEWERATGKAPDSTEGAERLSNVRTCPSLRLERVETVKHRDAGGHVAQGFLLSAMDADTRTAVLFTSDTGKAPSLQNLDRDPRDAAEPGVKSLACALGEADVVVAHVSSVPLSELRTLAGLGEAPPKALVQTNEFQNLWNNLREQIATAEAAKDTWARRPRFLLRQLQFGFHSRPTRELRNSETRGLEISPLSSSTMIQEPSKRHLYLSGLLAIAEHMKALDDIPQLLLIGELREELGTFRTRIASALNTDIFQGSKTTALTADIGLKVRIQPSQTTVLCTTCDIDNDLVDAERFHHPPAIREVCVKGEDEGVFYNCPVHEPLVQPHPVWIERIERYDPFGH